MHANPARFAVVGRNGIFVHELQAEGSLTTQHWIPEYFPSAIEFDPRDGNLIAYNANGRFEVFNPSDGTLVRSSKLQGSSEVLSLAFDPVARWLATGHADGTIRIHDRFNLQTVFVLDGHVGPVRCLSWTPDGQRLASGSQD